MAFLVNGMLAVMTGTIITYLVRDYGISQAAAGRMVAAQSVGNLIMVLLRFYHPAYRQEKIPLTFSDTFYCWVRRCGIRKQRIHIVYSYGSYRPWLGTLQQYT